MKNIFIILLKLFLLNIVLTYSIADKCKKLSDIDKYSNKLFKKKKSFTEAFEDEKLEKTRSKVKYTSP